MKLRYEDSRNIAERQDGNDVQKRGMWQRMKDRLFRLTAAVAVTITVGAGFGCSGASSERPLDCVDGFCEADAALDADEDHEINDSDVEAGDADADMDTDLDGDMDADTDADSDIEPVLPENSFANLIGDYLNRNLLDRVDNEADNTDALYPLGGSDTSENANPFTDGVGGNIGPTEEFLHRIDETVFEPLAERTVFDDVTGHSYVERQYIYVGGDNHYDSDVDNVVGRLRFLAYALKFDGPEGEESGITVCSNGLGEGGACSMPAYTVPESRRRIINFLGEEWIITGMDAPDVELTDANQLVHGGMIKLAKESMGGIIGISESLVSGELSFRLGGTEEHDGIRSAIIEVVNAAGYVIDRDIVDPGQTREFSIDGGAAIYRFHVYATFDEHADVALLATEIELRDNEELNINEGDNHNYRVALGWKNLGASGTASSPDALRTIVVYSDDITDLSTSGSRDLNVGDFVPIVENPANWRLYYQGLDLTSEDFSTLTMDIQRTDRMISAERGPVLEGEQRPCVITAPYLEVSSSASGTTFNVERSDDAGMLTDNEFIVVLGGMGCDTDHNMATMERTFMTGTVLMRVSPSSDDYGVAEYTDNGVSVTYMDIGTGFYGRVGDIAGGFTNGGVIHVETREDVDTGDETLGRRLESNAMGSNLCSSDVCPEIYVTVSERAGDETSTAFADYWVAGVAHAYSPTDTTFDFDSYAGAFQLTSSDEELLYGHAVYSGSDYSGVSGPVDRGFHMAGEGYTSERGSQLVSVDNNRLQFRMAHRLGRCVWTLVTEE